MQTRTGDKGNICRSAQRTERGSFPALAIFDPLPASRSILGPPASFVVWGNSRADGGLGYFHPRACPTLFQNLLLTGGHPGRRKIRLWLWHSPPWHHTHLTVVVRQVPAYSYVAK